MINKIVPEGDSESYLVALGRFSPSNEPPNHTEAELVKTDTRFSTPPRKRRRLTAKLRVEIVEAYQAGQTSRQVAETYSLGKSTVLGILKDAQVVRAQGHKY